MSLICVFSVVTSTHAATFSLEYKGFHERMKRVHKGNFPQTELVFSVPQVNGCTIQSGYIATEKRQFPLTYNEYQRVFIPFDEELKNNRGLINIEVDGDGKSCGIAMQIRVKQPKQQYDAKQLLTVIDEMDAMFDKLHGFPMKYFRDPLEGLTIAFVANDEAYVEIDGQSKIADNGMLQISRQTLVNSHDISFSTEPLVISPYLKQD